MSQILFIHGGDSYLSNDEYRENLMSLRIDYERLKYSKMWRSWIAEQLSDDDVLTPSFPNSSNAQYDEWVIYFEKIIPFLKDGYSLVGHSLGGMFLAKYLHTHVLPVKARDIVLIAARYGESDHDTSGSFLVESAVGVDRSADHIHLFHSKDDKVVEFESLALFASDIPPAVTHIFDDRGHFIQPTFPELLEILQQK
jgi:predicted alpha/beta hydrolase family esterase